VQNLSAKARNGTIKASGYISLSAAQGYPIQLGINMDNAHWPAVRTCRRGPAAT
jgi:translocation and assembly module TamB